MFDTIILRHEATAIIIILQYHEQRIQYRKRKEKLTFV